MTFSNKELLKNFEEKNILNSSLTQEQNSCHLYFNLEPYKESSKLKNNFDFNSKKISELFYNKLHPSLTFYQNFDKPSFSPLKRSKTYTGVLNSFSKRNNYNSFQDSKDSEFNSKKTKKIKNSLQKNFFEERLISKNSTTSLNKQLSNSTVSLLPNSINSNSFRQSLISIAAVLTKHSFSNTGRIISEEEKKSSVNLNKALFNEECSLPLLLKDKKYESLNFCKLCLQTIDQLDNFITLQNCECSFCKNCLQQYCKIKIHDHSFPSSKLTCPSTNCPNTDNFLADEQIFQLVDKPTYDLYKKIQLDLEVHLDPSRVWCPKPNCETVCFIDFQKINNVNKDNLVLNYNDIKDNRRVPVHCKKCNLTFCLHCRHTYHGIMPCQSQSEDESLSLLLSRTRSLNSLNELIKRCPCCGIYIERDKGCAQMMCQKCKHVFCWFCLGSLKEDLLLKHYDSGPCKNKLGHSRGTMIWLRFQIIAVFLGFALFLILTSPLFLIAAPILLIANCCCNFSLSTKIWNVNSFLESNDESVISLNSNVPVLIKEQADSFNIQSFLENQKVSSNIVEESIDEENIDANLLLNDNTNLKPQQLVQTYIQKNGLHQVISFDKIYDLKSNSTYNNIDLYQENPILLSGLDRKSQDEKNNFWFLNWFKWRRSKLDPPPRLSSMLDVEKHKKFMDELMANKLNLDEKLNTVDIDKHYIKISDIENIDFKPIEVKKKWWKWSN